MLEKNIFLLWLQGWDKAKWLNKQVAESWEINNPDWTVHYIDLENLKDYVTDIDYIYDETKIMLPQTKADIIRLSLLKNYGGVWADATMLCMQPLDHWVFEAVEPAGLWMYHGDGGGGKMPIGKGPAIWFIVSQKEGDAIRKWKEASDNYWATHDSTNIYHWLDELFCMVYKSDSVFRDLWDKVPNIYCELDGQSHTLAHYYMQNNTPHIKQLFLEKPPYALKMWWYWSDWFPDVETEACKNSNGYYAIQMSKRRFLYKHIMT